MPLSTEEYNEFRELIATNDRSTERQCQAKLEHAQALLFPVTVVHFEAATTEMRSFYGDSDFCVCADVRKDGGGTERQLAIWELKSPQCIIMERDDNANRWRPTKELIKAETQLLHYYHSAKLDGDLHRRFDVYPENILPGGIIMGRADRWCADQALLAAAHRSNQIRQTYFYRPVGFRFLVWDRVLEFVAPNDPPTGG